MAPLTRPVGRPYTELILTHWGDWEAVSPVRMAIAEHDRGYFRASAMLVDNMFRDDRVRGVWGTRANALLGLPIDFDEGKEADGRSSKQVARELEETYPRMLSRAAKGELLRWGHFLGVGIGQLVWDTEGTYKGQARWTPRLQVMHPAYARWDTDTQSYWLNVAEGEVQVTPGDGRWVVYEPYGRMGFRHGLVRSLVMAWLSRVWAIRDWARYCEVHGLPTVKAITPPGVQEDDSNRFVDEIAGRGSETTVHTPRRSDGTGYDFEMVEAVANTWETFKGKIEHSDSSIAITLLGQTLTTDLQNKGSRAAAQVHDDVRSDIKDFDARSLEDCEYKQVVRPWAAFNFAAGEAMAPQMYYLTDPPEDLTAKGESLKAFGEGILALTNAGIKPDVDKLAEECEVPTTGPYEAPRAPPAPAAAAGLPGGGAGEGVTQPPATAKEATEGAASLADVARGHMAALEGQAHADALVLAALPDAVKALSKDRLTILRVIQQAKSLEEIGPALEEAFKGMDETALGELLTLALIEAELAGMYSAREG
jgi:phage gp29-like protein